MHSKDFADYGNPRRVYAPRQSQGGGVVLKTQTRSSEDVERQRPEIYPP